MKVNAVSSATSDSSELQLGFSEQHASVVFDRASRRQKAMKVLAVLEDQLGDLKSLTALDLGCAAGNSTVWYGDAFRNVVAVDIDHPALAYAARHNAKTNIAYAMMNGERLALRDESFDVVICAHVYEHVPDARKLLGEIHRLLKPGGVCFFSAGNRLSLIEPHYRLPLLSVMPRFLSHLYLRLLGRGSYYYERHLTYWGLRKLVSAFSLVDYTRRIVEDPVKFNASEVVRPGSLAQALSRWLLAICYWACPTYIWVLKK